MKTEHSRLKRLKRRVFISYGAMTEIFGLLPQVNVVCFQRVNKWMYNRGVLRIQMSIKLPDKQPLYFPCMKNWSIKFFNSILSAGKDCLTSIPCSISKANLSRLLRGSSGTMKRTRRGGLTQRSVMPTLSSLRSVKPAH